MFDSLDDQIRSDEHRMTSNRERAFRWVLVGLVSVVVFGGLYLAVHFMQG
jgi:hypothetical protein